MSILQLRYQALFYRFFEEFNEDTANNLKPTYVASVCLNKVDDYMIYKYCLMPDYYDGITQSMYFDSINTDILNLKNKIKQLENILIKYERIPT